MVKLNVDMITKLGPGFNKRRADETVDHYLNRLSHIYLQEKHIDGLVRIISISDIVVCVFNLMILNILFLFLGCDSNMQESNRYLFV